MTMKTPEHFVGFVLDAWLEQVHGLDGYDIQRVLEQSPYLKPAVLKEDDPEDLKADLAQWDVDIGDSYYQVTDAGKECLKRYRERKTEQET